MILVFSSYEFQIVDSVLQISFEDGDWEVRYGWSFYEKCFTHGL